MDIKKFHDTVRFFINKDEAWFSDEEIDDRTHDAQMLLFNDLISVFAESQKISTLLSPFLKKKPLIANNGLISISDCELLLSVSNTYYEPAVRKTIENPIKILNADEIAERKKSQILEPTFKKPIAEQLSITDFQLYPEEAIDVIIRYLVAPAAPIFKYTGTGREPVYDKTGSTQLKWPETAYNNLIVKTAQLCGVNISDQMVIQYTEMKDKI